VGDALKRADIRQLAVAAVEDQVGIGLSCNATGAQHWCAQLPGEFRNATTAVTTSKNQQSCMRWQRSTSLDKCREHQYTCISLVLIA
jgi:hypothetical protein